MRKLKFILGGLACLYLVACQGGQLLGDDPAPATVGEGGEPTITEAGKEKENIFTNPNPSVPPSTENKEIADPNQVTEKSEVDVKTEETTTTTLTTSDTTVTARVITENHLQANTADTANINSVYSLSRINTENTINVADSNVVNNSLTRINNNDSLTLPNNNYTLDSNTSRANTNNSIASIETNNFSLLLVTAMPDHHSETATLIATIMGIPLDIARKINLHEINPEKKFFVLQCSNESLVKRAQVAFENIGNIVEVNQDPRCLQPSTRSLANTQTLDTNYQLIDTSNLSTTTNSISLSR